MRIAKATLIKLSAFAGVATIATASHYFGLGDLPGLVGTAGIMLHEGALTLTGHWGVHLLDTQINKHADSTRERTNGARNQDLRRLMGEAIARVIEREAAQAPGGKWAYSYLKEAAELFRGPRWLNVEVTGAAAAIDELIIERYFKGDFEDIKKNSVLSHAEWRTILEEVAGASQIKENSDALEYVSKKLSAGYTLEIWKTAEEAWKKSDLAWPHLVLRLLSLILEESSNAAIAPATEKQFRELRASITKLIDTVGSFAADLALHIPPEQRGDHAETLLAIRECEIHLSSILGEVLASQSRVERIVAKLDLQLPIKFDENTNRVLIELTNVKEEILIAFHDHQPIDHEHDDTPTDWVAYARALKDDDDLKAVSNWYVVVDLEPERFRHDLDLDAVGPFWEQLDEAEEHTSIVDVLEKWERVVLVGEPGAGKTSALQYLALTLANALINDASSRIPIPIYIQLSDWAQLQKLQPAGDLIDLISVGIERRSKMKVRRDALTKALRMSSMALIFDGLDEIRRVDGRRRFVEAMLSLSEKFPQHAVVIGSRKYGFTEELRTELWKQDFVVVEPRRLDDDTKLDIISRYAKNVHPGTVLAAINANYRVARLSDNALLLRLFSEQFKLSGANLPRTRGRAIERHVEHCIGQVELLAAPESRGKYGIRFLCDLAALMRNKHVTKIDEEDEDFTKVGKDSLQQIGISRGEFLDALVESRLIDRLADETIQFALPQFEDYFRARSASRTLRNTIRNKGGNELLALPLMDDRESRDVLIMAAGLLSSDEVTPLVHVLDDTKHMLLKAQILGESDAESEERAFGDRMEKLVQIAIVRALKGLARLWLGILLLWWLMILPVIMITNRLESMSIYPAIAVGFAYLVLVPLFLSRLQKALLHRSISDLEILVPQVMHAFSCLRTTSVKLRLQKLHQMILEQRPRHWDPEDVFVRLLDEIEEQIDAAAELAERDTDTIIDELTSNPLLVFQYLSLPPEVFRKDDVELFETFITEVEADITTKLRCLEKLIVVARNAPELRPQIINLFRHFAAESKLNITVRKLAELGANMHMPSQPQRSWNFTLALFATAISSVAITGIAWLVPNRVGLISAAVVSLFAGSIGVRIIKKRRPEWYRYRLGYALLWFAAMVCIILAAAAK